MFWCMTGLSATSRLDSVLEKEQYILENLLDDENIITEIKGAKEGLLKFLSQREQIKKLIEYIVEEAPDGADEKRTKRFVACEILLCEIDIVHKALVEEKELMDLLFSFLDPQRSHRADLASNFSKVVIWLLARKTVPLMSYIQAHEEDIPKKLVDLIDITPIMNVLVCLLGADEHVNDPESTQWLLGYKRVLEMILDKFSSSECPEVHHNAADTICAVTRYSPLVLASEITSPSFIQKVFHHALEDSRPKSVLKNLLSICITLLHSKRVPSQTSQIVEEMLKGLGDLLKLLDYSSESSDNNVLLTTYGKLQPPLGMHRLKVVEFIAALVDVGLEAAEKQLFELGAVKRIIELFFEYPFNSFLHVQVENIIASCLYSQNLQFLQHVLFDCNLIGKIIEAENNPKLAIDTTKPTLPAEGRSPPRIGNIGHITRIANMIVLLGNMNGEIKKRLQENNEWIDWHKNVLLKRKAIEDVFGWDCGRPAPKYDVGDVAEAFLAEDDDDDGFDDDDDDDDEEDHVSRKQDNEDDDECAEEILSSLSLSDDHESASDERVARSVASSSSPNFEAGEAVDGGDDKVIIEEDVDLSHTNTSIPIAQGPTSEDTALGKLSDSGETEKNRSGKSPGIDWKESSVSADLLPKSDSADKSTASQFPCKPGSDTEAVFEEQSDDVASDKQYATVDKGSLDSQEIDSGTNPLQSRDISERDVNVKEVDCHAGTEDTSEHAVPEKKN